MLVVTPCTPMHGDGGSFSVMGDPATTKKTRSSNTLPSVLALATLALAAQAKA